MQNENSSIERIIEALGKLAESYISLLRHQLTHGASHAVASLLSGFLIVAVFALALLFLNITLAIFLGTFMGLWLGFLIVSMLYLAVAFLVLLKLRFIRDKIEKIINLFSEEGQ